MALDITTLTQQGIDRYRAISINYPSNPRNAFVFDIKFLYFTYSDVTLSLTARFNVIRSAMFNGVLEKDIEYDFDSVAIMSTTVDKFGNIVEPFIYSGDPILEDGTPNTNYSTPNPDAWGAEFDRISILFNAPISDSAIVSEYQQELFDKGLFDRPKQ